MQEDSFINFSRNSKTFEAIYFFKSNERSENSYKGLAVFLFFFQEKS